ncbi:hypothetical protein K435DRAFT_448814 [Dendrothele bispora CBS 962.96]|uniref:Uncharacterized protein n=1 Tax=Dendrothele bispora (strain CBS 962.96) TaxID=1314807 RepID=A0A4S8L2E0_DENBC|nr:hypothetical protein K435DRAFT_448814 [Dendrothele bispora CBS 962.96]
MRISRRVTSEGQRFSIVAGHPTLDFTHLLLVFHHRYASKNTELSSLRALVLFFLLFLIFSLSLRILVNNTVTTFSRVSSGYSFLHAVSSCPFPVCVPLTFFRANHVAYINHPKPCFYFYSVYVH